MANQDGGRVLSSTKLVLIKRIPEFQEVEIVWQRFQSQILGEPLTNLPTFVTLSKRFQKRLMPATCGSKLLPSWIPTRFTRGSPKKLRANRAWNNSKSFEKTREDSRRKLGNLFSSFRSLLRVQSFKIRRAVFFAKKGERRN